VAGTATYLASSALGLSKFDPEKVDGFRLGAQAIEDLLQRFRLMTAAQRLGVGGMDRGRADVIVAGALILKEVLAAAGLAGLNVSVRGLRYGAVMDIGGV
jgi:exopolyphosphatase/guanosine-5'-triphosphate,3'-diphosphate pyrophosphatase